MKRLLYSMFHTAVAATLAGYASTGSLHGFWQSAAVSAAVVFFGSAVEIMTRPPN